MNRMKQFTLRVIIFILMLGTLSGYLAKPADAAETLYGLPISEFDDLNNAKEVYDKTYEEYGTASTFTGYQLKLRSDSYSYMYQLLRLYEKMDDNQIEFFRTHILDYNGKIKSPLKVEDQIPTGPGATSDTFVVNMKASEAKKKVQSIAGSKSDDAKTLTAFGQIQKIRKQMGYPAELVTGSGQKSTLGKKKLVAYVTENISDIRYTLTATKDYLNLYKDVIDSKKLEELNDFFIDTYDHVLEVTTSEDVKGGKNLNLFGELETVTFDPEAEMSQEYIGKWSDATEKEEPVLTEASSYLLKNIAISSTFKPFTTSLNSTAPFSDISAESASFHSAFGTKRKMILAPAHYDNKLEKALDIKAALDLKYMTLEQFIKNPDKPKILYVDNQPYSLEKIEKEQNVVNSKEEKKKEDDEEEDEDDDEVTDEAKQAETEGGSGFWNGVVKGTQTVVNSELFEFFIFSKYMTPANISNVLFASGDLSDKSLLVGDMKEKQSDINASYLVYNNIIEEYWNSSAKAKLAEDMGKPLYVDIYGNILTASGIVVIPAMANPWLLSDTKSSLYFNRAFIESYPQFTSSSGKVTPVRADKKKYYLGMLSLGENDPVPEVTDPDAKTDTTYTFEIPGVSLHVTKVGDEVKSKGKTTINQVQTVARKFNSDYEAENTLPIWSYFKKKNTITTEDYGTVAEALNDINDPTKNKLMMNEYSVGFDDGSSSEVLSFLEIPENKNIMKLLYALNIEHISEVKDNTLVDKKVLDEKAYKTISEVFLRGTYEINTINNLVPDTIEAVYDKYINFLLEKANDRYESVLNPNAKNNILYAKSVEEVQAMDNFLPLIYKALLVISIIGIITSLIIAVFSPENKFKQVVKIFIVIYLVTFMFNLSSTVLNFTVNKPTRAMFATETAYWTLVEQEKNSHLKQKKTQTKVEDIEKENGSTIKLFKIPYDYPFKLWNAPSEGATTLSEFYTYFLSNDNIYKGQNNEMYVEGNNLVTTTSTIFESSSIVVDSPDDQLMKIKHEIYNQPELAYYMPYYMFIDNMVYNLNTVSDLNYKIPYEIAYGDGTIKTTGRVKSWINSTLFLDYEKFLKSVEDYKESDKISEELSIGRIKASVQAYGEEEDFLGIRKIFNLSTADDLKPFTKEGIQAVSKAGWYPQLGEKVSKDDIEILDKKIIRVNKKVKRFMLGLVDSTDNIADEHLIKTISLYASLEFNKEFARYSDNGSPTAIELSDIPVERILMSVAVPREDILNNSVTSYSNYIVETNGYAGLLVATANDMLIVIINYIKPLIMVVIWAMAGAVIFFKKVIMPDPNNRSILGSLKLLAFYILFSDLYSLCIIGAVKMVNSGTSSIVGQGLLSIASIIYLIALGYMVYAMIKDSVNMGSSIVFKGLEGMLAGMRQSIQGALSSNPLLNKYFGEGGQNDIGSGTKHLESYFEQKSLKYADDVGDASITNPLKFNTNDMPQRKMIRGRNKPQREPDDDYQNDGWEPPDAPGSKGSVSASVNYDNAYREGVKAANRSEQLFNQYNNKDEREDIPDRDEAFEGKGYKESIVDLGGRERKRPIKRNDDADNDGKDWKSNLDDSAEEDYLQNSRDKKKE